jgi:MFS family permease
VSGSPGPVREGTPGPAIPYWFYVFVPVSAASAGFSVLLPLLILIPLHGNILEVALAQSLYNSALIPAAVIWGVVADRSRRRAPLLLVNYTSFAVAFALLALVPNISALLVIYTLYGFVAPSGAAAASLIILERFPPGHRARAFTTYSELTVIGSILGLLAGFLWVSSLVAHASLEAFLYVTTILSGASALGSFLWIRDPPQRETRAALTRTPLGLASRLRNGIPFFLLVPHTRSWFRRAGRWLVQEATHEVPLILTAGFLFNLATNLFNTSYIPYLRAFGLGAASIFLVNLANNLGQAGMLPFSARACQGPGMDRSVVRATWGRALGYAAVLAFAALPILASVGHANFLGSNVVAYAVLGAAAALYGTASSLLLFRSLEGRTAGSLIGANSALGGLAAVLGSAASGVVSYRLGFSWTFGISALVMASSIPLWRRASRAYQERRSTPAASS